jgi:hypothetical protein
MAQWSALQRWAADWLDAHPREPAEALTKASENLGNAVALSTVVLGNRRVLVGASATGIGTAFILAAPKSGQYRLQWSIADRQSPIDRKANRALSYWRPAVQNGHVAGNWVVIGSSEVGRLPTAANGARRFWITGWYVQEAGATGRQQLSLWSWRNGRVRPLLVREYVVMADQQGPAFRRGILHVPSKADWDSISACGSCYGRETDIRYAIEPHAIRALAPVRLTPELDVIDRIYARVLHRRPIVGLASPEALDVIRARLADRLAEKDAELRTYAGMVMGWSRWNAHGRRWACLSTDEVGATAFAFDRGRTRITAARALDYNACQGKGTRS